MSTFGFDKSGEWNKIVSDAEKIVGYPTSFLSLRNLLSDELSSVSIKMKKLVGAKQPLLQTARDLIYDGRNGMKTRGLIVLLISKAAGPAPGVNIPKREVVNGILSSQRFLAEIAEIIHTAYLIHRGLVNITDLLPEDSHPPDLEYGTKMAMFSSDYLLASACTALVELGSTEVLELVAGAIEDLMEADYTAFIDKRGEPVMPERAAYSDWLIKTYLEGGSLLAKSCQAALKLAGHGPYMQLLAHDFGLNVAYVQEMDAEIHMYTSEDETRVSVATAPVLLFQEQNPEAAKRLLRGEKFCAKALQKAVRASGVLHECGRLRDEYISNAVTALSTFDKSEAKRILINIAHAIRRE